MSDGQGAMGIERNSKCSKEHMYPSKRVTPQKSLKNQQCKHTPWLKIGKFDVLLLYRPSRRFANVSLGDKAMHTETLGT